MFQLGQSSCFEFKPSPIRSRHLPRFQEFKRKQFVELKMFGLINNTHPAFGNERLKRIAFPNQISSSVHYGLLRVQCERHGIVLRLLKAGHLIILAANSSNSYGRTTENYLWLRTVN